jgi:hypothetical protein
VVSSRIAACWRRYRTQLPHRSLSLLAPLHLQISGVRLLGLYEGVVAGDERTGRAHYSIRRFPEMGIW